MADTKTTQANAKAKAKVAAVAMARAEKIKGAGGGFVSFIREQGIIGLAVGLAVGAAAGAAVKQIVDGLINPVVGFIIGGINLSDLTWVVVKPAADGTGGLVLAWGAVVSALITLTATALVVYWAIHAAKLDRLDKKKS